MPKRKQPKKECPSTLELYLHGVMTMDDLIKVNPNITMKELAVAAYEHGYHVIPSLTIKESAEAGGGLSYSLPSESGQEMKIHAECSAALIDHHQELANKLRVPRTVIKAAVIQHGLAYRTQQITDAAVALHKAKEAGTYTDAAKAKAYFESLVKEYILDTESNGE